MGSSSSWRGPTEDEFWDQTSDTSQRLNHRDASKMYTAVNRCRNYDSKPYNLKPCKNQNHKYHHNADLLQSFTEAMTKRHQHTSEQDIRLTRAFLRRQRTIMHQHRKAVDVQTKKSEMEMGQTRCAPSCSLRI